ncbi:unnamed protein product [Vitrella brassicaformis CCMP3155]|uniref:Uncharacterized protein n=1 Tax=Vitrella brassicaformis (strain CCMP3155) TaxID=1169540 RepID=A0A0G4EHT6_VITBC|nr:unnamed protein product [Vitrella brassicaformis CCMP3155]|mmetsp:Transcript_39473/g.98841  ORF Transcript_39473/g.98841 Transcript_39473/m.98841 type:complete len:201 (+) Transcript_39473:101-703(+)|eukprot:CEL95469.1 unnamed protein product [Vitrella brassicaformis CCMP3155]
MDERCDQFFSDAQSLTQQATVLNSKVSKDLGKLRRFLMKNQEHRFTPKAQQRLFDTIGIYVTWVKRTEMGAGNEDSVSAVLDVVKDALAMPFTVFGTKHKTTLLQWHDHLTAAIADRPGGSGGDGTEDAAQEYQALSLDEGGQCVTVWDESAEATLEGINVRDEAMRGRVKVGIDEGKMVHVRVGLKDRTVLSVRVEEGD